MTRADKPYLAYFQLLLDIVESETEISFFFVPINKWMWKWHETYTLFYMSNQQFNTLDTCFHKFLLEHK